MNSSLKLSLNSGALDLRGVMCLFDPQAHTYVMWYIWLQINNLCLLFLDRNTSIRDREVYWDGGPEKIKAFSKQHAPMCGSNWVCKRLGLKDAIVEHLPRAETCTPSPEKKADRHSVNFLVN